ncbi:hypothetical protein [Amycolatopsis sp. FDAARGOS 1241]|uniref:hypothetical protein n=1 Tax=Amycolatopsis sp. FDAARGOS 1241 TaxID=2778070 RepID=UPI00194DD3D9|nr:hypothetical protein [Amycolatopsis sp. FDAARGOS 1241]QRP47596.1 hypothetical protein I6J71_06515 [Amycolatopsis sp. FDAARGOS 1241]
MRENGRLVCPAVQPAFQTGEGLGQAAEMLLEKRIRREARAGFRVEWVVRALAEHGLAGCLLRPGRSDSACAGPNA